MTCQLADLWSSFDFKTTGYNLSSMQLLQQPSVGSFRIFNQQHAPADYVQDENSTSFPCTRVAATLLVAVFAIVQGANGLGMVAQPYADILRAKAALAEIFHLLTRESPIDSLSSKGLTLGVGTKAGAVRGEIELRDVVFAYPSAPEHSVCNGYSLQIAAGQTCALCGPSGSGKSTLVALVERFYDPQQGSVTLDGVDVTTLNVRWLRQQLGLVGQEPVLFMGTVAENIAYGKEGASRAEVEEAARMANAHTFISESLAEGYDTQVGQGGGKLSGGQKQRVAIARAIVRRPAVLLLDEATSALDNESERVVQAALDEIMAKQKRTTVVIAHRLSTIRAAEKIAVVNEGRVVEEGTFDSLMAIGTGGLFFKLAKKQEDLHEEDEKLRHVSASDDATGESKIAGLEVLPDAAPPVAATAEAVTASATRRFTFSKTKSTRVAPVEGLPPASEATPPVEEPPKGLAKRVWGLQKESHTLLLIGVIFAIGSGGMPMLCFYFQLDLFTAMFQVQPDTITHDVIKYATMLLGLCALCTICFTADSTMFGVSAARLSRKLRLYGMKALLRQDIGFFDFESNSAGELTAFLAAKVTLVEALTGGSAQAMLRATTCVVIMLTLTFTFGPWQLAIYLFVAFPIFIAMMIFLMVFLVGADEAKKAQGKEMTSAKAVAERGEGSLVGEVVQSIRTVSSFGAEERFYSQYCAKCDHVRALEVKAAPGQAITLGFALSFMLWVIASIYFLGGYLNSIGETDLRGMLIPIFMTIGASLTISGAATGIKDMKQATRAAWRFFQVTDRTSPIDAADEGGATLPAVRGEIELRDVVFAYPSAPEHSVCNGYSLQIAAGQTCALCGPSGSGKSTLVALVERFYDPQQGSVTLDGVDVTTLNVRWLRQQLGLVGQEPVLFMGTVAENIAYGKEGASRAEVEEAARMANAHTFISESLAEGYDTQVGQGGGKLSGGQKQRVAIARAIVRRPAVLLLDEATAALDNESERVVQAALDEIMAKQKRTTVVIAHRLSTIRAAEKIAVVNEGRVVEEGTHEELLGLSDGLYSKLALQTGEAV